MSDAITREEKLMEAIATGSPSNIKPITREEMFLAKAGGQDLGIPEPITRKERFLKAIAENAGGSKPEGTIQITENGTHDVTEYASAEVMVSGGGDIDALIDGSITEITSNAESVKQYMFYTMENLISVDLPKARAMGSYAFNKCTKLTSANLPLLTEVSYHGFYGCENLTAVDFPLVTKINESGFYSCKNLTAVDFPLVTDVVKFAFQGCEKLKTANLPLMTNVTNGLFQECKELTDVNVPMITNIESNGFYSCVKLTTLVLKHNAVVTLASSYGLGRTPFAIGGTGGTVYVPQALIEEYKIATNWSTLYEGGTCNFVAIEGSEYE